MNPRSQKPQSVSGELALIEQIRRRTRQSQPHGVSLGIGDDCALLRVRAGEELAVTTDLCIEGRHFHLGWHPAESAGHRTLARGLSDLAAMGARPVAAFLSLAIPKSLTVKIPSRPSWVEGFFDGLLALAAEHKVPLAGGDLAEAPLAVADIVLVGAVPRGKALLRSAARAGDRLFVTGVLGGADTGLACLRKLAETRGYNPAHVPKKYAAVLAPHFYPQPRIAQGLALRKLANSCMDMSDGLSTDLAHLCDESGVAAEVDAAALPLAPGATLELGLHGGDDYQLLFTAPASARVPAKIAGLVITQIGRIVPRRTGRPQITVITAEGRSPLEAHGWQHFV